MTGKLKNSMSDLFRKRYASSLSTSAIESEIESLDNTTNSSFQTAIVKDVISNPISYFSRTYKEELDLFDAAKAKDSGKAVSNADLVEFAPRNSILAFNISSADAQGEKNPEIFFPFFPPHLSMPAKPGEAVWVFYEQLGTGARKGYWLCRKSGYRQVDDINYTSLSRELDIVAIQSLGENLKDEGKEYAESVTSTFPDYSGLNITMDDIVADSVAYLEEFVGEPVPRYSKKCGDLVLQGSNNTLISLGTDTSYTEELKSALGVSEIEITGIKDLSATINERSLELPESLLKPPMAGCIDLVAGRGLSKLNEDEESIVKNNRNDLESFEHYEINKGSVFTGKEEEKSEEGRYADGDYYAKVSISMRSMPNAMNHSLIEEKLGNDPDIKASIDNYNTQVCSSVISNAQSIKNFAGSSIEHQSVAGGSMFISDGVIIASAGGAYIHLKPDGNISIVPGPNGTIKLGDENADKAVLGLQGSETVPGVVTAPPLVTTAGGAAGVPVSTSTGEFGTKILIK